MTDIAIRTEGRAGRITLQRPDALNALTYQMCLDIEAALDIWRGDDAVALVMIDAAGDRAFCAGGDIAEMYATGMAGNFDYGRRFWADEYRLNHKIYHYPKPVVSFLQGYTMGGGVGVGCHGSHRIACGSSQIAMPECGIGLVPDVGGSLMLARAPGGLGAYLGCTGARMGPGDAIRAGFADLYVDAALWPELKAALAETGDPAALSAAAQTPPPGPIAAAAPEIDTHFASLHLPDILESLRAAQTEFAAQTLKAMHRASPLSMACTLGILGALRAKDATLADALEMEFRFTARSMAHGDFIEGIRAAIIDKDRTPRWQYADMQVPEAAVAQMLAPLSGDGPHLALDLGGQA